MSTPQRNHNRRKGVDEAARLLNKMTTSLKKQLDRRIATFPDGEYVLALRCTKQDRRTGMSAEHMRVVGHGGLMEAFTATQQQIVEHVATDQDNELADHLETYTIMPEIAERRAKVLRHMIHMLWTLEGNGETKHIYKVYATDGRGFEWWKETFPTIPFTTTSLDTAQNSKTIYPVILERLRNHLPQKVPDNQPEPPPEPAYIVCTRKPWCDRERGHVGACSKRRKTADMKDPLRELEKTMLEQGATYGDCKRSIFCSNRLRHVGKCNTNRLLNDPATVYETIKNKCHADEVFQSLTPADISVLKVYLANGTDRAEAYRLLGYPVTDAYKEWMASEDGQSAWKDISEIFPTYLDHLSKIPVRPVPRPVIRKKKKRKMIQNPPKPVPNKIRKRLSEQRVQKVQNKFINSYRNDVYVYQ